MNDKPYPKLMRYTNCSNAFLVNGKRYELLVWFTESHTGYLVETHPNDSRPIGSYQSWASYGWEDYEGEVTEEHIKVLKKIGIDYKPKGDMKMCEKVENKNNWEFKASHPAMINYELIMDDLSFEKPIGLIYVKYDKTIQVNGLDEDKKLIPVDKVEVATKSVVLIHPTIFQKAKLSGISEDYKQLNELKSRKEITALNNWVRMVKNAKYTEKIECDVEVRLIEVA